MKSLTKRGQKSYLLREFKTARENCKFYPEYGAGLHATSPGSGTPMQIAYYGKNKIESFSRITGIPMAVVDVFLFIYWKEGSSYNKGQANFFPAKSPERFVGSIKVGANLSSVVENLFRSLVEKYEQPSFAPKPGTSEWSKIINDDIATSRKLEKLIDFEANESSLKFLSECFYRVLRSSK